MNVYRRPAIIPMLEDFPLIKTQGSQFEVLCRPELDCDTTNTEPCCVANEGYSVRIRVGIENSDDPCSVSVSCDFLSETLLNCQNVTMTPVGACGNSCVYDLTCEGLSGPCPEEDTVSVQCGPPGV